MRKPSTLKKTAVSRIAFFALLFVTMAAATLHLGALTAHAASAQLSWTAPTTYTDGTPITSLGGYKVYTGTASGSYSQNVDVGNVTSYTLASLNDSTTYYFAVTAYDATGTVSGFSNQATITTPTPATATPVYTITASAGSGGSITPSGSIAISQGLSQTYTIAPSSGYKIAGVAVDGVSVGAVSSYTFSNVAANHQIAATFSSSVTSYTITASAGTGGSISPAGTATVSAGGSQSYTVTPNTGYYVASVSVDGTSVASNIPNGAGYSYTFSNAAANHTISATFAVRYYNIVATAGSGGSVSPANTWVLYNTSQAVTMTPSSGYKVADVKVDGTSVGAVTSYTFSNVAGDHTLSVTFVASYTITASAGTGGTISPSGATAINAGASQTYTIAPSSGYKIAGVTVDGVSVGAVSSYTFSNVAANHQIAATFSASVTTYSITASAGTNGSISPSGITTVNAGASQSYTVTPNAGYYVVSVVVDGKTVASNIPQGGYSYTFSNAAANHTISATFAIRYYNLVASAGTNGSVSPTNTWVQYNTSQTVSITPSSGHKISNVQVDGVSVGAVSSYTFNNISAAHTVTATFL